MNAFLDGLVPGAPAGGPPGALPPSVANAAAPSVPGIDVPPVAESEGWLASVGRQFSWWWILGLFGLALVVGGVWYFMRREPPRERSRDRPRRKDEDAPSTRAPPAAPASSHASHAPASDRPALDRQLVDRSKPVEVRPPPPGDFGDEPQPEPEPAPPIATRTRRRVGAPM